MKFVILTVINAIILLAMFLYFRYKINKTLSGEEAGKVLRDELEGLVRDINRITMRNSTIIESKISELREAVERGEKCIVSLSARTKEKEETDILYRDMKMASLKNRSRGKNIKITENQETEPGYELNLDFGEARPNEMVLDKTGVENLISETTVSAEKRSSSVEKESINQQKGFYTNKDIVELFKKGNSAAEISKQISKPQGEVEMIIELYS